LVWSQVEIFASSLHAILETTTMAEKDPDFYSHKLPSASQVIKCPHKTVSCQLTHSLSLSLALLHVLVDIDIGINVFLGLTGF